jgi:hypothetical protein
MVDNHDVETELAVTQPTFKTFVGHCVIAPPT